MPAAKPEAPAGGGVYPIAPAGRLAELLSGRRELARASYDATSRRPVDLDDAGRSSSCAALIIGSRWLAGTSTVGAVLGRPEAAVTRWRGGNSRLLAAAVNGLVAAELIVVKLLSEPRRRRPSASCFNTPSNKSLLLWSARRPVRRRPAGPPPTAAVAGRRGYLPPALATGGVAAPDDGRILKWKPPHADKGASDACAAARSAAWCATA